MGHPLLPSRDESDEGETGDRTIATPSESTPTHRHIDTHTHTHTDRHSSFTTLIGVHEMHGWQKMHLTNETFVSRVCGQGNSV